MRGSKGWIGAFAVIALAAATAAQRETTNAVHAELNGLRLTLDPDSGGIMSIEYADMKMLEAEPGKASLVDLAYPGYGFDPLRLGTRYSHDALINVTKQSLTISWGSLGMSRPFEPQGRVATTVRVEAMPDGRSLSLTCTVDNQSKLVVPQVLFPDLDGLVPFAGEEGTEYRTTGFVKKPFKDLPVVDDGRWYGIRRNWEEYKSGSFGTSIARWMDFGSLQGGISLFPKLWSWGPLTKDGEPASNRVYLHRSQVDGTLRLMCEHRATINPGESWTSPEYVLTPHRSGWAKGIEPFRAWVQQNVNRPYPLPEHLRTSLGYRSIWMAQQYAPVDDSEPTVVWRFADLPALAEECKAHGLNELVAWGWQPWEVPDQSFPQLGTAEQLGQAIADCRALGVNVNLFISVVTMPGPAPLTYGWDTDTDVNYTYHTDFIPKLSPYYCKGVWGMLGDQANPAWQRDVTASLLKMIDRGWASITWDQALGTPTEPNIYTIFAKVRAVAKANDPESTFAGESLNNMDMDSHWLDYIWNWNIFSETHDWRALLNAYATPRINVNVGTSARTVKWGFMDHLFLNVMPSKPEGINGSARIGDYRELSGALKTCAKLHAQFLPYFEDGVLIGDCVLREPCPAARINGYVLPDRILIVALNPGAEKVPIAFACDLGPWLSSPSGRYRVTVYDESGDVLNTREEASPTWRETTAPLNRDEMALFEVIPVDQ